LVDSSFLAAALVVAGSVLAVNLTISVVERAAAGRR